MYRVLHEARLPGLLVRDLRFTVPLDHFGPAGSTAGPTIEIAAREVTQPSHDGSRPSAFRPYLLYLQGGPGFAAPSPVTGGVSSWITRAAREYRVLLLDQRGTGLSSPINAQTLRGLTPEEQCARLKLFRSDSIVEDCELIREALHSGFAAPAPKKWTLLGQSWGGFIATRYAHVHPKSIAEIFITGGIPITLPEEQIHAGTSAAQKLYRATYRRVLQRNREYYDRFPGDVAIVRRLVDYLDNNAVCLPRGGALTSRRLRLLGIHFGLTGGYDHVHYLVNSAFVADHKGASVLSDTFLKTMEADQSFDNNPIYALLHEAIYCDGGVPSAWAAQQVLNEFPQFTVSANAADPVQFFGEMVFPWMFDDFHDLRPLQQCAELLAQTKWSRLYPPTEDASLIEARKSLRGAAVSYYDDMYVELSFSEETLERRLPSVKLWVTNEFDHSGLRTDGERIIDRLFNLSRGFAIVK